MNAEATPQATATRPQLVAQARQWLGTPYHHQARLRGVGVDCVGLVIGVARELALLPPSFDVTGYGPVPDGKTLIAVAHTHMHRLPAQADMQPGDVVVVAFDQHPQHVGIVGDYRHGGLSIIHAASKQGRVIETRLQFGAMRFVAAFGLQGVHSVQGVEGVV